MVQTTKEHNENCLLLFDLGSGHSVVSSLRFYPRSTDSHCSGSYRHRATLIPPPTIPATPVGPVTGLPQGTDGYPWWNDTVFYEIFVRSFYESDRDGIGDFNGIMEKLDYLNDGDPAPTTDLGVTGLWLMPIHPSPSYHGYDVTDYYGVNPHYGTMEDFKRLLDEAHQRGIRVTIMPDLNLNNPAVTQEAEKVASFWLQEIGVDGFRLDAGKHLIEDGQQQENTPEIHNWYDEDIRRPLQWSGADNAGFTTGSPWRAPASDYTAKNIADQSEDPNSLLAFYRSLIYIRNHHAALRVGDYYEVDPGNRGIYAALRASKEETILILINLSSEPVSDYALHLGEGPLSGEYVLAPLSE